MAEQSGQNAQGMDAGKRPAGNWSYTFEEVLDQELDAISRAQKRDSNSGGAVQRAHRARLVGLAFSGGGIRSATFNLGVLQGLAKLGLLNKINYLSTVSGGGYIGSWLMAWLKRRGAEDVCTGLQPDWDKQPGREEPQEIHFLRRYSNYLTPQLGWFGADMWTLISIYLRNLILNLIVLVALLSAVLLVPRMVAWLMYRYINSDALSAWFEAHTRSFSLYPRIGLLWLEDYAIWIFPAIAMLISGRCIALNLHNFRQAGKRRQRREDARAKASTTAVTEEDEDALDLAEFPRRWSEIKGGKAIQCGFSAQVKQGGKRLLFHSAVGDFMLTLKFKSQGENENLRVFAHILPLVSPPPKSRVKRMIRAIGRFFIWLYLMDWISSRRRSGWLVDELDVAAKTPHGEALDWQQTRAGGEAKLRTDGRENIMEIACVEGVYTLRLNGRTLHSKRRTRADRGWLVIESDSGIMFNKLLFRELEKSHSPEQEQAVVQITGVLPLFLAAWLATGIFEANLIRPDLLDVWSPWLRALLPWQKWALIGAFFGALIVPMSLVLRKIGDAQRWVFREIAWLDSSRPALWQRLTGQMHARLTNPWRTCVDAGQWLVEQVRLMISMALACMVGGIILDIIAANCFEASLWKVTAFAPPAMIGVLLLVIVLHVGFVGRGYPDEVREWWSRFAAWLLIYLLAWLGVFLTAFYLPPIMRWAQEVSRLAATSLTVGWIVSTVGGVVAAHSSATGKPHASRTKEIIAAIAPYIFIIGLFALLSWSVDTLLLRYNQVPPYYFEAKELKENKPAADAAKAGGDKGSNFDPHFELIGKYIQDEEYRLLYTINEPQVWTAFLGLMAVSLLLSWRLDINQFSMHMLYRNRLARCYLGASNRAPRQPQPFTGFDPNDDLPLAALDLWPNGKPNGARDDSAVRTSWRGPYPIFNAALNLVGGTELAWQQRKAASFIFTPKYCGYDFTELPPGFVPTKEYASNPHVPTVATAMAVSGAAASPNAGYHSSPAPTFLMTVFNVRLGWWIGNPRHEKGYTKSSPAMLLVYLILELFGMTNARKRHVYVSDGGHFENLGIYELVRRRCRFIIACDAEEDHKFEFGGLGNAIEKCRSDLGIDIEIDVEPIRRRNEQGHSQWHCAIGKIHYDDADGGGREGTLVYIKSSLTGDEPTDVLRYADANPGFPHQSTADQWFDESQFESYRALGFHAIESVFGEIDEPEKLAEMIPEKLFVKVAQRWYPPSSATEGSFTAHTRAFAEIYRELRENPNLEFLTSEIYPEWESLDTNTAASDANALLQATFWADAPARNGSDGASTRRWLPETPEETRNGFYICTSVIQLMEDVYLDLKLEQESGHPDNRGWMNLFKRWSWSEMFRVTWAISASTYGARFQNFCERHLGLKLGAVEVKRSESAIGAILDNVPDRSADGARELNGIERKLIEHFFQAPGRKEIRQDTVLYLLQLRPKGELPSSAGAPAFTFGFALIQLAERGRIKLRYLRVQDHLRRAGLARAALHKLIGQMSNLQFDKDENPMPAGAPEVSSEENLEQFAELFQSVKNEIESGKSSADFISSILTGTDV